MFKDIAKDYQLDMESPVVSAQRSKPGWFTYQRYVRFLPKSVVTLLYFKRQPVPWVTPHIKHPHQSAMFIAILS